MRSFANSASVVIKLLLPTLALFHQLGARRKLQKARPFLFILQNVLIYKTDRLIEAYAVRRVGEIEPLSSHECSTPTDKSCTLKVLKKCLPFKRSSDVEIYFSCFRYKGDVRTFIYKTPVYLTIVALCKQ